MATINFLYRSTKESAPLNIRLLYRVENKDYVIGGKTQYIVTRTYWNDKHMLTRSRDAKTIEEQNKVRNELFLIEKHVLDAFNKTHHDAINKEWLKLQLDEYYKVESDKNPLDKYLTSYYKVFIEHKKNEITLSSIKKYNVVLNLLIRYQNDLNTKLKIEDVNLNFKASFEAYCIKNKYAHNTISKALRTIKTVCNHAKVNGYEVSSQLEAIKPRFKKVSNIYLSFDELKKIENIKKTKLTESLSNAKDWLIISCYVGQRVSDFMNFNKNMIRIEKGKHLIEFTQKKTNKTMTVPLAKEVLKILDKRDGNFPRPISDQKYNKYIKDVCELAKINEKLYGSLKKETEKDSKVYRKVFDYYKKHELVSSHIGRRSFATNFYGTIPTSYLIYATGHSSESMFLQYIGKSNKDIAMELAEYF
ncbi:tyrosine-type recombinase/integrase [Bizionia sp.]|uniref:tyrosine-type recombinase/integrase n=1 Tax=Bizionia sp. TaxID=1954480 RepID=UPI003A925300